jgi:hypothetical protein
VKASSISVVLKKGGHSNCESFNQGDYLNEINRCDVLPDIIELTKLHVALQALAFYPELFPNTCHSEIAAFIFLF